MKRLSTYLSGEIHTVHTDWCQQIEKSCCSLAVSFIFPITDHSPSNTKGDHLGHTNLLFWLNNHFSPVNALTTQALIQYYDLAVFKFGDEYKLKFGDEYKQWNATVDIGYCTVLSKPYLALHSDNIVYH